MATLALSVAGQVVGGAIAGPIGATIGRALGALAGSAIDNALFGQKAPSAASAGSDIRLQGSAEGGPIPRIYGWTRLTGNIIWATQLEEVTATTSGGKGTSPATSTTTVLANFAVGLCEGEAARLGRIWADGQLLETEALNIRFYRGSADQLPDSLIEAKQGGAGTAPAYRGLCYLVFEGLDLTPFGNRIPNLSVELCRVVGTLEPAIRAVTIIPAATEFGYDPVPRVRLVSPGTTDHENAHLYSNVSDWTVSLDELQALCPNLQHVSLVVAWFGDDLDAGSCTIAPRVETATRTVDGTDWAVSGLSRGTARGVSQVDGSPAYGGTPSDASVIAAIHDLQHRGLSVTLYPMILMDVPAGNVLVDPYTGATGQPAYPWRGRITCAPAPGQAGTPDQTAGITTPLAAFLGSASAGDFTASGTTVTYTGPTDWGFRRFVLHYAKLAAFAGGVDAFIVGSELRGLTTLRGTGEVFPFVSALATLAADVRAVLGGAKLTYAADWSEFSGYQPADAPGDKFFHLDALWASAAIDALGLDNYMPLADWRDGTDHIDAGLFDSPYDPAYLSANIAGGEGFDWFYASDADRIANARTPITDGTYGEPWVWRFKDLVSWWSNAHHDRAGGVRSAGATAWVPGSKPIWLTELGCPAVDKGANQPNVFPDPKSSESAVPWFSNGAPDALAQRQVLRTHLGWWRPDAPGFVGAHNPAATLYDGRMVDPDRLYLWTWDARPYPAFPNDVDVWADGANYATGHWLNGRLGGLASDELAAAIAADYGLAMPLAEAAPPLLFGLDAEGAANARDTLQPVLDSTGLMVADTPDGLVLARPHPRLAVTVPAEDLAAADNTPLASRRRPDAGEAVGRLSLGYVDRERDYLSGSIAAQRFADGAASGQSVPLSLDLAGARFAAERMLADAAAMPETLDVALPPSLAALEPGDMLDIGGQGNGPFVVTELRDAAVRSASLSAIPPTTTAAIVWERPLPASTSVAPRAIPIVAAAHLPANPTAFGPSRLMLAATASPWPGSVDITDEATGAAVATLTRSAAIGELTAPLAAGPTAVWDEANALTVTLYDGHLASADDAAVLAGANRLALQNDGGEWEIVGFADAALVSPGTYALSRLLRGQGGTGHAVGPAAAGNRVLVLDSATVAEPVSAGRVGDTRALHAYAGRSDAAGQSFAATIDPPPDLPLAPVHLTARRDPVSGDVALGWIRCSRADDDSWNLADAPLDFTPEAYTVTILDGITPVRTLTLAAPACTYAAADQIADFGGLPASFAFTVAQVSAVFGPGLPAKGAFHG